MAAGTSRTLTFKEKVKQQKLRGWQPTYDAKHVVPIFFAIGTIFISVGIALLHLISEAQECVLDYTDCQETTGNDTVWYSTNRTCADIIKSNKTAECYCRITFSVDKSLDGHVFMYYGLSNFYQNHRRYTLSRDDDQLLGHLDPRPSPNCEPFAYSNQTGQVKPIAPCGAVANSMFNDKLWLYDSAFKKVPLIRTGIAWNVDKERKFRNPPGDLKEALRDFSKPIRWKLNLWELDLEDEGNNGFQNEDLIVWMRTAAFSTFKKLYRKIDHESYGSGFRNGSYVLQVEYNFEVKSFHGTKKMILATTSTFGGKNYFLGMLYTVVGAVSLLLAVVFIFLHHNYGVNFGQVVEVDESTSYFSL